MSNIGASIEPITGRYINVGIAGRAARIYFEEAGQGIPLVCLHTAGSDGRQFRYLMLDEEITSRFRVIAFDLPHHGKSNPYEGYQDEDYRLTTEVYEAAIMAFCQGLGLENPVLMGCSMGGRIVLHMAGAHGDYFRAVIGLEASDHQQPWYDTDWLNRPDVHGGEVCAAMISGLVAPQSPDTARWETLWGYLSSGPGVFKGDLHFYRADSDFRDRTDLIDTTVCPVFLLTGEYDFSCTPTDTLRTAKNIAGAEAEIMEELGHFPMSENPEKFREYLMPVLKKVERT